MGGFFMSPFSIFPRPQLATINGLHMDGSACSCGRAQASIPLDQKVRALLSLWQQRSRQRKCLLRLDPHLLNDIGVSRAQALAEAAKPFWVD